ncbi:hypothetical protein RvY_07280 [Ramazzottius varieornatus]|uniref:Uncharacterized protein n=1 Tax=Ramazzottius varieornatus TaxID=947166 RepID=A0A1D1V1K0_RAMVA|nr:hypothetical protein RvY_07280 [Ramazzottius varieornatus]
MTMEILLPLMAVFFCTKFPTPNALPLDKMLLNVNTYHSNVRSDHMANHLPPVKPSDSNSKILSGLLKMISKTSTLGTSSNSSFTMDDFRRNILQSLQVLNRSLENTSHTTLSNFPSDVSLNLTMSETSEEMRKGLTTALQHDETRTRIARFVNPVLLKLLLDYSSFPRRPFIPPAVQNGGLSERGKIDLALIGSFTLLGLAIIATFPVQQPAPSVVVMNQVNAHEKHIAPPSGSWTSAPEVGLNYASATHSSKEGNFDEDASTEQPYETEIISDDDEDSEYETTTPLQYETTQFEDLSPQFLKVLVSFVNHEPVQVDVVNEGDFMANYTYREPRL